MVTRTQTKKKATRDLPKAGTSGPSCLYRKKIRDPMSFTLTADARLMLAAQLAASGLSRSDYLESLIRRDAARTHRAA